VTTPKIQGTLLAAIPARGDVRALTDVKPLVSAIYQDHRCSTPMATLPHIRGGMHTGCPDRRMDRGV